jgi:hypothetical protein
VEQVQFAVAQVLDSFTQVLRQHMSVRGRVGCWLCGRYRLYWRWSSLSDRPGREQIGGCLLRAITTHGEGSCRHRGRGTNPGNYLTRESSIDLMPQWRHQKERFRPRETNVNRSVSRKVGGKSRPRTVSKRKRSRTARRTDFRSFGWYEKAALSIGIRARAS